MWVVLTVGNPAVLARSENVDVCVRGLMFQLEKNTNPNANPNLSFTTITTSVLFEMFVFQSFLDTVYDMVSLVLQ